LLICLEGVPRSPYRAQQQRTGRSTAQEDSKMTAPKATPAKSTTTAKKAPATVTEIDPAKTAAAKAAAKAAHPATVSKAAPAKPAAPTAPKAEKPAPTGKLLPANPAALTWAPKSEEDPTPTAIGTKYTYRLSEGTKGGWFAELRTTSGGRWVNVAGRCETREEAQTLCRYVESGCMWLTYAKLQGTAFADVIANHYVIDAK
jgi:hypothetical protein